MAAQNKRHEYLVSVQGSCTFRVIARSPEEAANILLYAGTGVLHSIEPNNITVDCEECQQEQELLN